jgi:hypothetical protein
MAIIGISGYSGSGKDTVGKIIQYIECKKTSKVSLKKALSPEYEYLLDEQSGWEIKKWAGKLKEVASLLTGIPVHKFEDQEFKKTVLGPEWNKTEFDYNDGSYTNPHTVSMTVRDFLQRLGTDGLRNGLHRNTWVNALMADYKLEYKVLEHYVSCLSCGDEWDPYDTEHFLICCPCGGDTSNVKAVYDKKGKYPNWIITDTRFRNEADAIREAGGIIIRVDRPGVKPINNHSSETSLDHYQFDEYITNDGDLNKLTKTVKEILLRREYYDE